MKNSNPITDELSVYNNPLTKRVNSTFSNVKLLNSNSTVYHEVLKEEKKMSTLMKDNMQAFMNSSSDSFRKDHKKAGLHKNKGRFSIINNSTTFKSDLKPNEFNMESSIKSYSKYSNDKTSKNSTTYTTKYKQFSPSLESTAVMIKKKENKGVYDKSIQTLLITPFTKKKIDEKIKSSIDIPESEDFKNKSIKQRNTKQNLSNLRLHLNKFYDYFLQEQKEAEYMNKIIEEYDKIQSSHINKQYNRYSKLMLHKEMEQEEKRPPSSKKELPFFYSDSKRRKFNFRMSKEESEMNYKERVFNFDKCSYMNEDTTFRYREYLLNKFQVSLDKNTINFSIPKIKMRPLVPALDIKNDEKHDKVKYVLEMSKSEKTLVFNRLDKNISKRKETLQRKLMQKKNIDESELDELFKL
jgi:hypothetical protein